MRKSLTGRLATGIVAASLAYSPFFSSQTRGEEVQEKFFPNTLVRPERVKHDLTYLDVPEDRVEELTGFVMGRYDAWVNKLLKDSPDELRGGEVSLARRALDKYPIILAEALQQVPGADFGLYETLKAELLQEYWFDKNFKSDQPRSYDLEAILAEVAPDSLNDPEIAAAVRQYNLELTPLVSKGIKLHFSVLDPTDGKLDLNGKPRDFKSNIAQPYEIFHQLQSMNSSNAELIAKKLGNKSEAFMTAVDNARYPGMGQINARLNETVNLYNSARDQAMNAGDEARLAELESARAQLNNLGVEARQAIISAYNVAYSTGRIGNLATELYDLNEGIKTRVANMRTYDDLKKRRKEIIWEMPQTLYGTKVERATEAFQGKLDNLVQVISSN